VIFFSSFQKINVKPFVDVDGMISKVIKTTCSLPTWVFYYWW